MGVRRETVSLAHTNGISVQAEVEAFEPDFVHRTQVVFLRRGRLQFSAICPIENHFHVGQVVDVDLDPERLYFFDTPSGKRL